MMKEICTVLMFARCLLANSVYAEDADASDQCLLDALAAAAAALTVGELRRSAVPVEFQVSAGATSLRAQ